MDFFKNFLKTGKNRVGIDIGAHSVKTVEISREKDVLRIANIGYANIKKHNSVDSIMDAIKESAAMAKVADGRGVNIAVPGFAVVIRFVEFPRMNEDELRNAVVFEAEKYIPFSINEVIVDHQLIVSHLGDNKMLVLLIAAKKDIINERLELINRAGMSADILDVAPLANVNAFLTAAKRTKNEIAAVINMGAKTTDINIIADEVLCFARNIQIGGDDLTKSLSDSLSLDAKSAEDLKISPKDKAGEVSEKFRGVLRAIIDEIHLSFSYYENQFGKNIERVYLGGGAAKTANMCGMMKESLDMDILLWDPLEFIALDPLINSSLIDAIKYQMGTAVGLALRQ